jgi:hypothetical protein
MMNKIEVLEDLLANSSRSPAGQMASSQAPLPPGALPPRFEQFLEEVAAHSSEEAGHALGVFLEDFGGRLFRHLLAAGMNRRDFDTDLTRNRYDVGEASRLLRLLAIECGNTPYLPPATAELLGRVANALFDIVNSSSSPALFDVAAGAPQRPKGPRTAGAECEGRLAAALEIVILGGMKLAEAQAWIETEIRKAGLVDAAGGPITGERVAGWRNHFNKGRGAAHGRTWFRAEITGPARGGRALLLAEKSDLKLAACQRSARRLVVAMARLFNRTVTAPKGK